MRAKLSEPMLARMQEQAAVGKPIPWEQRWVAAELESVGWCWVRGGYSTPTLRDVLSCFGTVVEKTHVQLDAAVRSYLCDWRPVPIHTDHPEVAFVAWFCHAQDLVDGATLLVDSRPILKQLDDSARADLRATLLPHPAIDFDSQVGASPVLSNTSHVYFAPWADPLRAPAKRGYLEFSAGIRGAASSCQIEFRLREGDLLLIDNTRVLHGRRALDPNSPRHLSRFWIV